jgi:hypothetical protein
MNYYYKYLKYKYKYHLTLNGGLENDQTIKLKQKLKKINMFGSSKRFNLSCSQNLNYDDCIDKQIDFYNVLNVKYDDINVLVGDGIHLYLKNKYKEDYKKSIKSKICNDIIHIAIETLYDKELRKNYNINYAEFDNKWPKSHKEFENYCNECLKKSTNLNNLNNHKIQNTFSTCIIDKYKLECK